MALIIQIKLSLFLMQKESISYLQNTTSDFLIFFENLPPKKNLKSSFPLRFKAKIAKALGVQMEDMLK